MSIVDQDDGQFSEPAPEGNFLTKKLGPLPLWVWAIVGVAGAYIIMKKTSLFGGSSTGTSAAAGTTGTSSDTTGDTGTIDSSGNSNDVLTALESMLSTDAANITTLQSQETTMAKTNKNQNTKITKLNKEVAALKKKKGK